MAQVSIEMSSAEPKKKAIEKKGGKPAKGKLSEEAFAFEEVTPEDGIGEEIVSEFRGIFERALEEGASPLQAATRVEHRAKDLPKVPDAPNLLDRLSSAVIGFFLQGKADEKNDEK